MPECEDCGKTIAKHVAEDAIHATHQLGGPDGKPLCRRCLDRWRRARRNL